MNDNFDIITTAFQKAGIDSSMAEFSITEYSLNTDLSFKFNNAKQLLQFLGVTDESERADAIKAMILDSGVDPDNFFYVNFYRPNAAEL